RQAKLKPWRCQERSVGSATRRIIPGGQKPGKARYNGPGRSRPMPTPVLFALAAGLFMTAEAPQQNPQAAVKLWAGVGVNVPPVFHPPDRQHAMRRPDLPKRLVVHFAVVNDGAGAVNPDIESSQLLVNG